MRSTNEALPSKEIQVIRSQRRTLTIEIKEDLRIIVRVPMRMKDSEIEQIIAEKTAWIDKHLEALKQRQSPQAPTYTAAEIKELAKRAGEDILPRVQHFSALLGVTFGRVGIRMQKTRWGSCSAKGNLSFNCLLMLCPPQMRDYVVVHELCHRIELNHSPRFWAQVERILPDYKIRRKWLKDNGSSIIGGLSDG